MTSLRVYLLEYVSAIAFSLPSLCLQVKENNCRNSTHWAYLEFSLVSLLMKEGLVIRMYHKGLWLEIVTSMDKSLNDGIMFFAISIVVVSGATQLRTKACQGLFILVEITPMPTLPASHSTSKKNIKVGESQDRS